VSGDLLDFLEHFRPDGHTTFVGIVPDGSTVAETFNGADRSKALDWLERQNRAGRNIYFTVNATSAGARKKPFKADISAVAAVWADIDPLDCDGRSYEDERTRLIALADEMQALEAPPTFIVDSGNGVQPVWLLKDPIEASEECRRAAEALCARIEAALGAKGTHNADGLLRVPGSRNYPNEKKRKLGRGETQARLLDATWRRYSWREIEALAARLEEEPPAHAVPVAPQHAGGGDAGDLNLPPELPEPLETEWLEVIRANHPDALDLARYDGDQSRQDHALASIARRLGWPPVDAWRLIIAARGDRKASRRDYIERTLGRAYAEQDAKPGAAAVNGDTAFDLSHDGLALDMGRSWQREARHVALWGRWLLWNGARWEPDEKLAHMTRSRDYLRDRADSLVRGAQEGKLKLDADPEKSLAKAEAIAKSLRSAPMVANVIGLARSNEELVATVEQWDRDPFLLGTLPAPSICAPARFGRHGPRTSSPSVPRWRQRRPGRRRRSGRGSSSASFSTTPSSCRSCNA
jgi:D5 N terminal like